MDALKQVSIVIPLAPGEEALPGLRPQLDALDDAEIIIALGESRALEAVAASGKTRFVVAAVGRAAQQNTGARAATRTWLWFLHADSRLEPGTRAALARACGSTAALYYFDLRFSADGPALCALNALGARVRSRLFDLPFGDQGLLLPRALFERLGGFDESLALGEDLDFVRRARAAGVALRPIGATLATSARRYAQYGWLATTARNLRLTVGLSRAATRRIRQARA